MQWSHLRTFEAVARLGSLTAAARALGLSQSTVSRHISALEGHAGSPLLLREAPAQLTARGLALREAIAPMVEGALAAAAALSEAPEVQGEVALTTVQELARLLVRRLLVRRLPALHRAHPQLRLRILADNRVNSLAAGEADLALRLARPGCGDLVARRLLTIEYALFAAPTLPLDPQTPWLGLAGTLAEIPEQRLMRAAFADRPARLLVEDAEALALAVEAGLGVAALPRILASRLDVEEATPASIGAEGLEEIPPRALWLVVHRAKQRLPKIRAVIDWLVEALPALGP